MRTREPLRSWPALRRRALPVVVALLSSAAVAHADEVLDAADRAYDEGRIAEAERAYEDALATGSLEPGELARTHLRLGAIAGLAADLDRLDRHFTIALAIDPTIEAPAELSEELRARFVAMRGESIEVALERDGDAYAVRVSGAPEGLARTIEARGRGWERRFPWEGTELRIAPPREALPIEVRVLDPHGNRIAHAGVAPISSAVVAPAPAGENLLESPWLWLGVGVVVAGIVAIAIGFSASGERYVLGPPVLR